MVRVAVTQQEPLWFDLEGTVDKTVRLIEEAASNGAKLIAFPEVWACGYPMWIWARALDPVMATKYIKSSLSYDTPQMTRILAAAKSNAIAVVLGFSENENDSLYISQCTISAAGEIVMKRRKMKPTHMERTIFGDATGSSLSNVVGLGGIGKVGALSCFEHLQPLLKYHTVSQGERIHVAAWPPVKAFEKGSEGMFSMSAEGIQSLSQTYAMESTAFVLHCTSVLTENGIKAMQTEESKLFDTPGGGYSAVFGPDGRRITEPIPPDQEGIVYADLPLDFAITVRHLVDVVGHYSRPDLLWLGVDTRHKTCVRAVQDKPEEHGEILKL